MDVLEVTVQIAGVVTTLGLVAGSAQAWRWWRTRRRWRTFVTLVETWARVDFGSDAVVDEQFRCMTVNWMYEAEFTPEETLKLLDVAVLLAKARRDCALSDLAERMEADVEV